MQSKTYKFTLSAILWLSVAWPLLALTWITSFDLSPSFSLFLPFLPLPKFWTHQEKVLLNLLFAQRLGVKNWNYKTTSNNFKKQTDTHILFLCDVYRGCRRNVLGAAGWLFHCFWLLPFMENILIQADRMNKWCCTQDVRMGSTWKLVVIICCRKFRLLVGEERVCWEVMSDAEILQDAWIQFWKMLEHFHVHVHHLCQRLRSPKPLQIFCKLSHQTSKYQSFLKGLILLTYKRVLEYNL